MTQDQRWVFGRRNGTPPPVLLPGKSHGWRSLVGCSPWSLEESDTTERLYFRFSLSCIGEGNGSPVQWSCLENPRDGGAWWAAVYGVAQSRIRLKRVSSTSGSEVISGIRGWGQAWFGEHNQLTNELLWLSICCVHRDTEARTSIPEPQLTFGESNIGDQPTESRNFACVVCSYRSSALNDTWIKKKKVIQMMKCKMIRM